MVISAVALPIMPWVTTIGFSLAVLVVSVVYTSWGRFMVARTWFALSGRLPWRLMAFLDDAHERVVCYGRPAASTNFAMPSCGNGCGHRRARGSGRNACRDRRPACRHRVLMWSVCSERLV